MFKQRQSVCLCDLPANNKLYKHNLSMTPWQKVVLNCYCFVFPIPKEEEDIMQSINS